MQKYPSYKNSIFYNQNYKLSLILPIIIAYIEAIIIQIKHLLFSFI